jgi:catalase (peroxidase I)
MDVAKNGTGVSPMGDWRGAKLGIFPSVLIYMAKLGLDVALYEDEAGGGGGGKERFVMVFSCTGK